MKKHFVAAGLTCLMTLSVFGTSALAASASQADPPSVEKETVPHVHTCAISTADADCTHDVDILREETAQPVAGSGYIFIPAEYSDQLEDVDADSTLFSLLEEAVDLRLTFQPSMGCESLNCKDASHSHFCKAECVNEAHCHR